MGRRIDEFPFLDCEWLCLTLLVRTHERVVGTLPPIHVGPDEVNPIHMTKRGRILIHSDSERVIDVLCQHRRSCCGDGKYCGS